MTNPPFVNTFLYKAKLPPFRAADILCNFTCPQGHAVLAAAAAAVAATTVVAAIATAIAAAVAAEYTVTAAAAAEDQYQNNNPPAVIVAHKFYLRNFLKRFVAAHSNIFHRPKNVQFDTG